MESVKGENPQQTGADGSEPDQDADPEIFSEFEAGGQSVLEVFTALDARHDQRGDGRDDKKRSLDEAQPERGDRRDAAKAYRSFRPALVQDTQQNKRQLQEEYDGDHQGEKDEHSPSGANAVGTEKDRAPTRGWWRGRLVAYGSFCVCHAEGLSKSRVLVTANLKIANQCGTPCNLRKSSL